MESIPISNHDQKSSLDFLESIKSEITRVYKMPKKLKSIKSKKKKTTNEIKLNPKYYDELHSEEIYSEETRVGKLFGVRQKDTGEEFIQLKECLILEKVFQEKMIFYQIVTLRNRLL